MKKYKVKLTNLEVINRFIENPKSANILKLNEELKCTNKVLYLKNNEEDKIICIYKNNIYLVSDKELKYKNLLLRRLHAQGKLFKIINL